MKLQYINVDHGVYTPITEIVFSVLEKMKEEGVGSFEIEIIKIIHYKLLLDQLYGKTAMFHEGSLNTLKSIIMTWQDLDADDEGKIPYSDIATDEEYDRHLQYLEDNAVIAVKAITKSLEKMGSTLQPIRWDNKCK
tara:strand:+ start:67 stop:474 length:408 start_codon:yes stop_codon:yes gene_type:complete